MAFCQRSHLAVQLVLQFDEVHQANLECHINLNGTDKDIKYQNRETYERDIVDFDHLLLGIVYFLPHYECCVH